MKPVDRIWDEWRINGQKATCRHCNKTTITKHATRCRAHTASCRSVPVEIRKSYQNEVNALKLKQGSGRSNQENHSFLSDLLSEEMEVGAVTSAPAAAISNTSCGSQSFRSLIQPTLNGSVNKLSKTQMKDLQQLFVKAMINGNIAFEWLHDPVLAYFFEKLGSGFLTPTRRQASSTILNSLDQEALMQVNQAIEENRHLSIVIDGWKNCRGVPVINIMLANPSICIFFKSFEPGKLFLLIVSWLLPK